jgi:transcriptional regulator with XRE-family HTH domain
LSPKRTTAVRRNVGGRWPARPAKSEPEARPAGRRFAPSLKKVTQGGIVYGALVANQRTMLGLSQEELAARIRTSTSTIERIEQGHPPDRQIQKRLTAVFMFDRPSLAHRVLTKIAPSTPVPRPRISLGHRWLWVAVASVAIAVLVLVVSANSGSGGTVPARQLAVSQVLGPPATIHRGRVQAEKAAAAEARQAAERRREREAAAAAAAAAAEAKAAAKAARQEATAVTPPVTAPVVSSPAPSGGGGGGGSSDPAPELQHGIGAQGG